MFRPLNKASANGERLSRRDWLKAGGLLGLGLPRMARAEGSFGFRSFPSGVNQLAAAPLETIRSCILVFYYGGPSHLDTLDPKPNAPVEVRGEYGTIATSVPGIRLGPRAHVLPYVALPYTLYNVVQLPGQTPGMLGGAYDRFQIEGDPSHPDFRVAAFDGAGDLNGRVALLRQFDRAPLPGRATRAEIYRERALRLLAMPEVPRLFDLGKEPDRVRDRYGRHRLGQSLLLARRLVEGGVNFVATFDGQTNGQEANWDSHENLFPRHRQLILPSDQALSALIEDLHARGLLDTTLVIALGEFGRTPRINGSAGRDHWPDCYSVLLAGGGVRGGAVYGASDSIGAFPARDSVTPADLAATIFWRFGLDPTTELHDQTGRPFRLAEGEPLHRLFATRSR
jgi:hypothetical protein